MSTALKKKDDDAVIEEDEPININSNNKVSP